MCNSNTGNRKTGPLPNVFRPVSNEMIANRPRNKRTNEQKQLQEMAVLPALEDRPNLAEVAPNRGDSPEPGLVEKLMQQLNDLKEMVPKLNVFYLIVSKTELYENTGPW